MNNYEKLINTLKEVFMLDKAELDFGIYRIMNHKRNDIENFLQNNLIPQVRKVLSANLSGDKQALQKELDEAIKQAQSLGAEPDNLPKVQQLKARLGEASDLDGLENEVFSHLANFFRRYFDNGDFISMRRYKKDVYAIPYEGEEIRLHWANADQYYIKTSEYFKNYRFKLANGKTVEFELVEASTEQNNNKAQGDKERKFALYIEQPLEQTGEELKIYFTYEAADKKVKQDDLLAEAFDVLKNQIPDEFNELLALRPTEKSKQRALLQKHLKDYTVRNTFDYFIHKNLGGFLTRELDFFIKNEVLFIDDINTKDEQQFLKHLSKIKAIKKIGEKIITFLAQLENFQKKLWLKKKFVVETNYCITLDRVLEELYEEIVKNEKQVEEWVKLFAIDEIKADKSGDMFSEKKTPYSKPLSIAFLKENPYLVLDTAFFTEEFKWKLIAAIDNFDEQGNGLLVSSENFQALNLMQNKYKNKIKYTYIDPPYNAQSSEILYKNTFKHSSWLSLIDNRIELGKKLLQEEGVLTVAIDEVEQEVLGQILTQNFPNFEKSCIAVNHNPSGQQGDNFSFTHEYAFFLYPKPGRYIAEQLRENEKDWDERNFRDVTGEDSLRTAGANCFYPILIKENKVISFGDVCPFDFHPKMNEEQEDGTIAVYPIDPEGIERKWRFARQTVEGIKEELIVNFIKKRNVYDIKRLKKTFNFKSNWVDSRYSANNHGTQLLNNIIPKAPFSYPKSIFTVQDSIIAGLNGANKEYILDYFAGSGTTGHAVINLNREDNGNRKYILVEMGTYFDTVTKPRIQKVIYSKDWKDGKPVSREGISHCFKYIRLESYEDTLNNLSLQQREEQKLALSEHLEFREGYMLNYMLDVEAKDSLLNLEWFIDPFNCYLNITRNNESKPTKVDMVETFNYLIGLVVENYSVPKAGYVIVTGTTCTGDKTLVIWRDCNQYNSRSVNEFLVKSKYNPLDTEFDRIYINGDNNIENLKTGEERWKVMLIEEEFKKKMFEE